MKRTTIYYGGQEYVVARTADELRQEIDGMLAAGGSGWLTVNHGRGTLRAADILLTPGVAFSMIDTSDPAEEDIASGGAPDKPDPAATTPKPQN